MCQFFLSHLMKIAVNSGMSACNQMLAAASKVTMIRRIKTRKSVSPNTKKSRTASSVVHQTNNVLQPATSDSIVEVPRYLNSYRLESKNSFNCSLVYKVLEEIMQKHFRGIKYDLVKSASKVKTIAGEVMNRVKNYQFDRYRLIVYVQIGENRGQEFQTVVRFLWDSSKDKFVTYNLTGGSLFITATCFGIYLD